MLMAVVTILYLRQTTTNRGTNLTIANESFLIMASTWRTNYSIQVGCLRVKFRILSRPSDRILDLTLA